MVTFNVTQVKAGRLMQQAGEVGGMIAKAEDVLLPGDILKQCIREVRNIRPEEKGFYPSGVKPGAWRIGR